MRTLAWSTPLSAPLSSGHLGPIPAQISWGQGPRWLQKKDLDFISKPLHLVTLGPVGPRSFLARAPARCPISWEE